MKRMLSVCLVTAGLVAGAFGQEPPASQPQAGRGGGPSGEAKLRAICRQLKLSDQQMKTVETLVQVYQAELDEDRRNPERIVEEIRQKYGELRNAQEANDTERVRQLREELRSLAPTAKAEKHFFEGLLPILTDAQKTRLEQMRRAENAPPLKAVRVHDAATQLDLTPDQQRQLEAITRDYRSKVASNPNQPVQEFVDAIRQILTARQADRFEQLLDELRQQALTAPTTRPATTQPATTQPSTAPKPPGAGAQHP